MTFFWKDKFFLPLSNFLFKQLLFFFSERKNPIIYLKNEKENKIDEWQQTIFLNVFKSENDVDLLLDRTLIGVKIILGLFFLSLFVVFITRMIYISFPLFLILLCKKKN